MHGGVAAAHTRKTGLSSREPQPVFLNLRPIPWLERGGPPFSIAQYRTLVVVRKSMRILLIVPCLCSILSHAQQSTTTNPNTPSAAVMPLSGQGIDATSSTIVTDALVDELMKTGSVRMMERSQMEAILKEQGFQ